MNRSAQDQRVKTALDETRLLILGAQILFGFHLNGAFQSGFSQLSPFSRGLHAASFLTMAIAIALLITPSLQHQFVDGGHATARILTATTGFAGAALLPIALSLGADLYIVIGHRFGADIGAAVGIGFALMAVAGWYGAEWLVRRPPRQQKPIDESDTPIDMRVEHMLTEARVMLPGAQALLGFQLAVILTDAFAALPGTSKVIHVVALCCVSLAVILLMAPASFHRLSFHGQNTESFYRLGSTLVLAAAVPLAGGIVGDLYVAVTKALDRPEIGAAVAVAALIVLAALWLVHPLLLRTRRRSR
ncbi:MAG: DUF6328 family protein [Xanthobacteraceae bacterium]